MGNNQQPPQPAPPMPQAPAQTGGSATAGKTTQVQAAGGGAGTGGHMMPGGILLPSSLLNTAPAADLKVHAPEEMGDAIQKFRTALDKGDADGAQLAWSFAKPEDKHKFGKSPQINRDLQQIARVAGPLTIHVMADAGLDFTSRTDLIDYMLKIGFPHWFDMLGEVGGTLMASFMAYLPARDALDDKALAKLDKIILGVSNPTTLKPLFERVYVPLSDNSYDTTRLRTTAWKVDQIHRLYRALRDFLPVAHVRTVRSFHLGTEVLEDGQTKWEKLDYAWWSPSGYVVLNESDANAKKGEDRNHRMTGGSRAHADPKTGKGKEVGAMDRFEVGALHEVGHAVGDALGGHAWAQSNRFVGWATGMSIEWWSRGLWGNDVALTVRAKHRADGDKPIASVEARHYLANKLLNNALLPPDWKSEDKYREAIFKQYGDQPLAAYFKQCFNKAQDSWYQFPGTQNFGSEDRVYVYLSRGGSGYSSYKQDAFKQKVSWYSMASPQEWFAEQYAHYYRTGKSGEGLEPGVATKLAELDKQQPPAQSAQPAQQTPGEKFDGDGPQHRVPFPW